MRERQAREALGFFRRSGPITVPEPSPAERQSPLPAAPQSHGMYAGAGGQEVPCTSVVRQARKGADRAGTYAASQPIQEAPPAELTVTRCPLPSVPECSPRLQCFHQAVHHASLISLCGAVTKTGEQVLSTVNNIQCIYNQPPPTMRI